MILIPLLALLNAARGSGTLPRWLFFLACFTAALTQGLWEAVVIAAGIALYFMAGWHFDAITGAYTLEPGVKVRWINWVCLKLIPAGGNSGWVTRRNMARGTLWLSLRGLHLYPAFIGLACLHGPHALLLGLGCLLQGPIYFASGRLFTTDAGRKAEVGVVRLRGAIAVVSLSVAMYVAAAACHLVALLVGFAVLWRFGKKFRHYRGAVNEFRYLTVALSTLGNVFLGGALTYYLWGSLNTYLEPQVEFVFAAGHLATAVTPIIWHGLTYCEMLKEEGCGTD